ALDGQTGKLFLRIAEQFSGPRVRIADASITVGDDNPVGREFKQVRKTRSTLLRGPLPGDIADKTQHHRAGGGLQRLQENFGGKLASILAQPAQVQRLSVRTVPRLSVVA